LVTLATRPDARSSEPKPPLPPARRKERARRGRWGAAVAAPKSPHACASVAVRGQVWPSTVATVAGARDGVAPVFVVVLWWCCGRVSKVCPEVRKKEDKENKERRRASCFH